MIGRAFEYCPLCAGRLERRKMELEDRIRPACPACGFVHYNNPVPAAGVILVTGGRILLVKRRFEPQAGGWTLPAGFVESGEDVRTCAAREAKEETGLDVEITRVFDVYSAADDPRASVVLVLFVARRTGGELVCGDDASDARYFGLDDLPANIAFRAHAQALRDITKAVENRRL